MGDGNLVQIRPRIFKTDAELLHWQTLCRTSFGPWYGSISSSRSMAQDRCTTNAVVQALPEFFLQAQIRDGSPAGFLSAIPGYWNGEVETLSDLDEYMLRFRLEQTQRCELGLAWRDALTEPAMRLRFARLAEQIRVERLSGANCIILVSIMIDPRFRGLQLPALFFEMIKQSCQKLRFSHIIGVRGATEQKTDLRAGSPLVPSPMAI